MTEEGVETVSPKTSSRIFDGQDVPFFIILFVDQKGMFVLGHFIRNTLSKLFIIEIPQLNENEINY